MIHVISKTAKHVADSKVIMTTSQVGISFFFQTHQAFCKVKKVALRMIACNKTRTMPMGSCQVTALSVSSI